mmetsp:Transcript_26416/g.62896  ORF Transcript_26416/g.62896 Transcript_26416/m.62896 type:complete len:450 (+) Transcript_26416:95-1444(+)
MPKRQTSSSAPASSSSSKRTRLDRNLTTILPKDRWEDTASRRDGVPASVERLQRLHGTSLIIEASTKDLGICSHSTTATACCLFHRFYHHPSSSLSKFDVWSVAMSSLLLATKIDDGETKSGHVATMKDIIDAFARIYARRLIFADVEDQTLQTIQQSQYSSFLEEPIKTWTRSEQRQKVCNQDLPQKLHRSGTVYETWHRQITETESMILHRLGYTVYWIPESHPYKFLLRFCEVLQIPSTSTSTSFLGKEEEEEVSPNTTTNNGTDSTIDSTIENGDGDGVFVQTAWKYCNDSYRLDLSVRYPAEVIALSAMLLASIELDIQLLMKPIPWFEVFLGKRKDQFQDVVDVSNSILGIPRGNSSRSNNGDCTNSSSSSSVDINDFVVECDVATKGFMKSSLPSKPTSNDSNTKNDDDGEGGPAFLDPNSFLWDHQRSLFITQIEKTRKTS